MNKAIIKGNLTKAPEIRQTSNGNAVCNFSVATSSRYKDQSGQWQDKSEFHNCVAFKGKADAIGKHFRKGDPILLEGELQTRSWDDNNGNKRYTTEIVVRDFEFCERKGNSDLPPGTGAHTTVYSGVVSQDIETSDIPF